MSQPELFEERIYRLANKAAGREVDTFEESMQRSSFKNLCRMAAFLLDEERAFIARWLKLKLDDKDIVSTITTAIRTGAYHEQA
jgi:hypothetical protein